MTAVAIQHRDTIIAQIATGKRITDIIAGLNADVSVNAISKVLKDDPEYAQAVQDGHAARLDHAEYLIECSGEQVDVARARALWSAYSWRAERESERWRAKSQVEHTGSVQVERVLRLDACAIFDAIPVVSTPQDDALRITDVMSSAGKQQIWQPGGGAT